MSLEGLGRCAQARGRLDEALEYATRGIVEIEKVHGGLGAGSLAERIEAAISAWIDYLGARPSVARLLLREVADARPGCPPPLLDHIQPIAEMAATAARAEPDGSLGEVAVDPAHLASIIAGATEVRAVRQRRATGIQHRQVDIADADRARLDGADRRHRREQRQ